MMTARILVVDDDAAIRSSLAQRLGEQSYSVSLANDGAHFAATAGHPLPDAMTHRE